MRATILTLVATAAFLTGCATRQPFPYEYVTHSTSVTGTSSLAVGPTTDGRRSTSDLDKLLFIPSGLDEIIVREIQSTGKFAEVVNFAPKSPGKDFLLEATLQQLVWEVPKYDQLLGTAFGVSFLTGGVGGVIYGSTKTPVIGRAQIAFKLSKPANNRVVLEKQYSGVVSEKLAKFNCDMPGTKRRMASLAIRRIMDQFKQDLKNATLDQ